MTTHTRLGIALVALNLVVSLFAVPRAYASCCQTNGCTAYNMCFSEGWCLEEQTCVVEEGECRWADGCQDG